MGNEGLDHPPVHRQASQSMRPRPAWQALNAMPGLLPIIEP